MKSDTYTIRLAQSTEKEQSKQQKKKRNPKSNWPMLAAAAVAAELKLSSTRPNSIGAHTYVNTNTALSMHISNQLNSFTFVGKMNQQNHPTMKESDRSGRKIKREEIVVQFRYAME